MDPRSSHEPVPPGIDSPLIDVPMPQNPPSMSNSPKLQTSSKGVEFAKKRLRAFSIQKKAPVPPVAVMSPTLPPLPTGAPGVVVIGKLASAKPTIPMVSLIEDIERKKPPKPGSCDTYMDLKKRTLSEIEDMKRKMELVELGIPLGLIGPTLNSPAAKAMPTKAMPPIKSFLTTEQLDKIIVEAKKAKQEGREFKFDYQKLLPEYDNPFQRKKDRVTEEEKEKEQEVEKKEFYEKRRQKERIRSHNIEYKRKERRDIRDIRDRKSRERKKDKEREKRDKRDHDKDIKKDVKSELKEKTDKPESDLNINDFLVCDSWSLDNDDKNDTSSPKVDLKVTEKVTEKVQEEKAKATLEQIQEKLEKEKQSIIEKRLQKKMAAKMKPIERLQPVTDSFSFEIEEDAILDIFDEDNDLEKYAKVKTKTDSIKSDQDSQDTKDSNDDFLESVINEIKHEDLSDDESRDKGLVEYEMSPDRDSDNTPDLSLKSGSVTPELNDSMRASQRSDYSDCKLDESGVKSTESGFKSTESSAKSTVSDVKSTESGIKSTESGFKSTESSYRSESFKETPKDVRSPESYRSNNDDRMARSTADSLDTWSFVMKICQPLLFRHDRNKCYKETKALPSLWYTENPKLCDCVKDRSIVYEELETLKMELVDRVYSCEQVPTSPPLASRTWYPTPPQALTQTPPEPSVEPPLEPPLVPRALEWESEEEAATPRRNPDETLDQEYQRFMDAVWPEISETKAESRSTTPIKEEKVRKKKKLADDTEKKAKKIRLSENWSQESDVEEDKSTKKTKAVKKEKSRKRKRSSSSITETTDDGDDKKVKKRSPKKKDIKRKAKLAKRRRMERKLLKKQKNKNKKIKKIKIKTEKMDVDSDHDKEKTKKAKKKKKLKLKKKDLKKKRTKSTSSDSDSDSKVKKRKRNEEKRKAKKRQTSESQSDELFDVNILKNIKTEKEEKKLEEFSPRRQQNKQREIISMKELQNNLETGHVQIKQEVEENNSSLESCSAELLDEAYEEKSKIEENVSEEPQKIESLSDTKPINDSTLRSEFISPEGNMQEYDMYEQMAMEYQSGVKSQSQQTPAPSSAAETVSIQKIETVVSRASRGEIKCDWRPGEPAPAPPARPSRWGLKPGEANIVLTQPANDTFPIRSVLEDDYMDNDISMNYDEAYAHMYGASDRLQYGDCFARHDPSPTSGRHTPQPRQRGSLDDRINTVFEEQARSEANRANGDSNLINIAPSEPVKVQKRVSFADGYKPGQDSDVESPPIKRKKRRRVGCAWPCPASHPDHVPLWDALPPPPPPPSPPPPQPQGPPPHLLRAPPRPHLLTTPMQMGIKFDPNSIPGLLQEPPPGMMTMPHGSI